MAQFKIVNKEGQALNLKELDIEIAKFWNKELDNEQWANPFPELQKSETVSYIDSVQQNQRNNLFNWFDTIGWQIAHFPRNTVSWKDVAEAILHDCIMSSVLKSNNGQLNLASVEITKDSTLEDITLKTKSRSLAFLPTALEMFKPHIDLINYFIEKGYKPVQC